MTEFEPVLTFTETFIYQKTGESLNDLQRVILREVWHTTRKTYKQIATEHNYSSNYVQQVVGPRLWRLLSQAIGQKVTKTNVQTVLSQQMALQSAAILSQISAKPLLQELPCESVPLDSEFYVQRPPYEPQCYQDILSSRTLIQIKAPRQMGKTSLSHRILAHARTVGYQTATINFQQAEQCTLGDLSTLLRWICANISRQLKLEPCLATYWDEEIGHKIRCTLYLEAHILESSETPIVILFEEVGELLEYPQVAQEFFTMLRAWYENTKADATWQRLRLVMVYATETYVPLDINQSPFNMGVEIALAPFSQEQVEDLAQRHGLSFTSVQIQQLMALVMGHPYLVRLALYRLARQELSLETLVETAPTYTGIFRDHLHRHLRTLLQYAELETAFGQVLRSPQPIQIPQMYGFKLQSMGLVNLVKNQVSISCELYQRYFSEHLSLN